MLQANFTSFQSAKEIQRNVVESFFSIVYIQVTRLYFVVKQFFNPLVDYKNVNITCR